MQDNNNQNLEKLMYNWAQAKSEQASIQADYYCKSQDVFQARWGSMTGYLLRKNILEEDAYILSAIVAEIGYNSFDHNLGNWPDIAGIFFAYIITDNKATIFLADRGQGILKTLKKIKPELKDDVEAIRVAFTERISARSPENRGNGLKFVKKNIKEKKMALLFVSGNAQAKLNQDMNIKVIDQNVRGCLAILNYES